MIARDPVQPAAQSAVAWLDDFFTAFYATRPVCATFIGAHEHDHRLPDLSDTGAGDALATMRDLLDRFPGDALIEPSQPSVHRRLTQEAVTQSRAARGSEGRTDSGDGPSAGAGSRLPWHLEVDLRLARGFLRTQLWEWDSAQFRRANPGVFTGEAIFGVLSLFLTDHAPFAGRVEAAAERLARTPALLDAARQVIDRSPTAWTERAIRECDGALAFLADGLPRLLDESGSTSSARHRLERAGLAAAAAFARCRDWLDSSLRWRPRSRVASGDEVLDLYIRDGHFLDGPAREIERYAEDQLAEAAARLSAGAAALGGAGADEALDGLRRLHPPVDRYYARFDEILAEVRALVEMHDLLTWPDFPLRFVPRPVWARSAAPYLYFLFYRSPAAFGRPPVHEYLVEPIDASMPDDERERLLQATNDSVIRLNHVIHHGGIGHHVQNWHAFRSPSRIGRVAAVDCASRIAMFCGGTMAEGWACYATDLMAEHGALSALERLAEVRSRARMCARAIVDVRLHEGRFSLADAARFYETHAGMSVSAAHAEAVKNSMFPGAALMYLVGCDRIRALRHEVAAAEGDHFSLRRFHDTFLSFGSIPVSMIAALMTGRPLPAGAAAA